jgi:hypothetical protein
MKGFIIVFILAPYVLCFFPIPFIDPDCPTLDFDDCVTYCHCVWERMEDECITLAHGQKPYYTSVDCIHGNMVIEAFTLDFSVFTLTAIMVLCFCCCMGLLGFRVLKHRRIEREKNEIMTEMESFGYGKVPIREFPEDI